MEFTGTIKQILPHRTYDKKNGAKGWSQEMYIEVSNVGRDGNVYAKYPKIEINDSIDGEYMKLIQPGARLTFHISLDGRFFQGKDGSQGHVNTIRCYKVEIPTEEPRANHTPSTPAVSNVPQEVTPDQFAQQAKQVIQQQQNNGYFPFPQ